MISVSFHNPELQKMLELPHGQTQPSLSALWAVKRNAQSLASAWKGTFEDPTPASPHRLFDNPMLRLQPLTPPHRGRGNNWKGRSQKTWGLRQRQFNRQSRIRDGVRPPPGKRAPSRTRVTWEDAQPPMSPLCPAPRLVGTTPLGGRGHPAQHPKRPRYHLFTPQSQRWQQQPPRTPSVGKGSFSNSRTPRFLIHSCLKGYVEHSWESVTNTIFLQNSHIISKDETTPARDLLFWWRPQYHSLILHNPRGGGVKELPSIFNLFNLCCYRHHFFPPLVLE